jgi:ABC-type molybdate transport system permease subunit
MHSSLSKFLQSNFPHKSVLSLSNAIVGASVLSMPYCFQQVTPFFSSRAVQECSIAVRGGTSHVSDDRLCTDHLLFM